MRTTTISLLIASAVTVGGCKPGGHHSVDRTQRRGRGADQGRDGLRRTPANADTGEVMVHTWDRDLKTPRPVEREPITVGSAENSAELTPHPTASDPSGTCSRFYGHADWMRGGNVGHGWLAMRGDGGRRHSFDWRECWQGGKAHGRMWEEMGEHRRVGPGGPMGSGHGPGRPGEMGGRE